jgi:hypothetical protein
LESSLKTTTVGLWCVNNEEHLEKLRRKIRVQDMLDCKDDIGVDFNDAFTWAQGWAEPFDAKTAAENLKYRQGFVIPRPNPLYVDVEFGLGFDEFVENPVSHANKQ